MYDIIIIGGGVSGLTAAIYALRGGQKVLMFEKTGFGGQISIAPKVENYPGFSEISGLELVDNMLSQAEKLGLKYEFAEVSGITTSGAVKTVLSDSGEKFEALSVIIASGMNHRQLGVAGEEELVGNGISYCAVCDGAFYKNQTVAVIGGGNSAFQYAEFLSGICSKVYLVHRRNEFRADTNLVERLKSNPKVEMVLSSVITKFIVQGTLKGVEVKQNDTLRTLDITGLFVAVGHTPNTDAFSGIIQLDNEGFILAGEDCKTSVAGIFASGDCRAKDVRQLTTATGDGTVSATNAMKYVKEQV